MTQNELMTLAEREAQRLTDENDHSAAIIIRELMEQVRAGKAAVRGPWSADLQLGKVYKSIHHGPVTYTGLDDCGTAEMKFKFQTLAGANWHVPADDICLFLVAGEAP